MMKIKVVMGLVLSVTMVFNIAGVSYASVEASEMNAYENNLNNVLDYNEVDIIYSELESEYSYYHSSDRAASMPTDPVGLSAIIAVIIAEHGASYNAGHAIGVFCKNHKIPYKVGQGAMFVASGPLLPSIRAAIALGFENGYHSR